MEADWVQRKACSREDPRLWDAEAGIEANARALPICHRCPVKAECYADTEARSKDKKFAPGMYAGRMWGDKSGPKTVWQWNADHGYGLTRAEKRLTAQRDDPEQIEKTCAGVGCSVVFVVDRMRCNKRYHSERCRRASSKHRADLRGQAS